MRQDQRLNLLRRAILETASYLKRDLAEDDIRAILHELNRPGRPTKRGYTKEEIDRFQRMEALLNSKAEKTVTAAAGHVARERRGHSVSATRDWLRKNYAKYKASTSRGPAPKPGTAPPTVADIEREAERQRRTEGMRRKWGG